MAASSVVGDEVVYPDGRHALAGHVDLASSPLYNQDLAPVPIERRTWNTYNYAALWIGMAHNIPSYLLASGLVALGMDWVQAIMTIALGNLLVLVPMLLNSHAGTKYGIPYPVFARASFGVFGANLPAILRGLVACGWFGIQTWIGGQAIFTLAGAVIGKSWTDAAQLGGYPWTQWLAFGIFWLLNLYIILRGMDTLRRFENWAAPFVLVVAIFLLVWMVTKAHGFGPILHQPSKLGWGADFWPVFFPSLMGMIAFWSTLSLNMPDFTRFGGSQRQQAIGQVLGLPTTMTFFSLLAVLITSATVVVYGQPIWDPVALTGKFSSPVQRLPQADQLPDRRDHHRSARHPHPAVAAARQPPPVHLHLARFLRRLPGGDRRRAGGRLLAAAANRAGARRPVPGGRRLPLCERLELAGRGQRAARHAAGRRRRALRAEPGPFPRRGLDPVPAAAVQL